MNQRLTIKILLLLFLTFSCKQAPPTAPSISYGNLEFIGLNEETVNRINIIDEQIYICSTDGFYKLKEDLTLDRFGLKGKDVVDIASIAENSFIGIQGTILIDGGIKTIWRKSNGGTWSSYMRDFGGEEAQRTRVENIESPTSSSTTLFASTGGNVVKSIDSGNSWTLAYGDWTSVGGNNFIEIKDAQGDTVFVGGISPLSRAFILKSITGGQSWTSIKLDLPGGGGAATDLIYLTDNELIISLYGGIIKSANFGETWGLNFSGPYFIDGLAQSKLDDSIIYGIAQDTEWNAFIVRSLDYGDSWELIDLETGGEDLLFWDIESTVIEGEELLLIGSTKGLLSFDPN